MATAEIDIGANHFGDLIGAAASRRIALSRGDIGLGR